MKKDNKTNAILNQFFGDNRDGYLVARMAIIDLLSRGINYKFPKDETIRKQVEKRHANDGKEYTDENGKTCIKFSLLSAELEIDLLLCEKAISDAFNKHEITAQDFFACANEFYK